MERKVSAVQVGTGSFQGDSIQLVTSSYLKNYHTLIVQRSASVQMQRLEHNLAGQTIDQESLLMVVFFALIIMLRHRKNHPRQSPSHRSRP